jgi:hypothetical protein
VVCLYGRRTGSRDIRDVFVSDGLLPEHLIVSGEENCGVLDGTHLVAPEVGRVA